MMKKKLIILPLLLLMTISLYSLDLSPYMELKKGEALNIDGLYAQIETSKGDMVFLLDYDSAPLNTVNFILQAQRGVYDSLKFYKNIENYAIFSGDPQNNGLSQAGDYFPMENNSAISHNRSGILSMDGISGQSSGSRFFITKSPDPALDKIYSAFGVLVEGDDVLNKLKREDIINSITIVKTGSQAMAITTDENAFTTLKQAVLSEELEEFREKNPLVAQTIEKMGPEVKKTLTGIYYIITEEGLGKTTKIGDLVSVHYTGRLLDGTVFDSSIPRGAPFEFNAGTKAVITGWDETVVSMKQGEKRTILLPPSLAYGDRQAGPIPAGSWLIFDIELMDIK